MRLYLLRHADAENFVTTDAARVLTEKGRLQAAIVGGFLLRTTTPPDLILTSPYLRALQTAQAVAACFPSVPLQEDRRLGCGLDPDQALEIIGEHEKLNSLLLVGHQPDLGHLASCLLNASGAVSLEFPKAGLLTVSLSKMQFGAATLESFVDVRQMG